MNRDLLLNLRLDAMKGIDIPDATDPAFKELARVLIPECELNGNKVFGPFMEKYAELLVRECIGLANKYAAGGAGSEFDVGYISCAETLAEEIKTHFGVE